MDHRLGPSSIAISLLAAALLAGCSAATAPPLIPQRPADWLSPLQREHALVGRIYDVAADRTVSEADLDDAVIGADVVLLGEQHDNADHHRIQAGLLADLVAAGRHPAVAFEQIDLEKQGAVDKALSGMDDSQEVAIRATAVAEAVEWARSGWPPFDQYRGIFETAISAELPLRAANLSRASMMELFQHTAPAKGAGRKAQPTLEGGSWHDVPLSAVARAAMVDEIQESHCGYADDRLVTTMLEAQRRRDDAMATAVNAAFDVSRRAMSGDPTRAGVVVICGFGHARKDFGVPLYLRSRDPSLHVVTVAFLEVFADGNAPADYARVLHAASLPFDYVVFTPRVDDDDPCEKFRSDLQKLKGR